MKTRSSLLLVLFPLHLLATPLTIAPIPWVQSNPNIPHIALNGLPTHLQAIAEGGTCNSYSYRWDINSDGDFDDTNENSISINKNAYFAPLHLETTLPNALGNTYIFPKVEVTCGQEIATATYPIEIIVDGICNNYINDPNNANCGNDGNLSYTRKMHSNRSIDNAMWYLFRQAIHKTNDSLQHDEHLCYIPGNQTLYTTGHTLNVFLRRGHGYGANRDNDPYYRNLTQCGLHSILATMQLKNIGFTDTDTLGTPGKGMEFVALNNLSAWYWASYESTAWAEPLANFGNPDYISPVGRVGIYNTSLKNIGQDLIDGLLQCTTSDGAWFYTCMNMTSVTDDASTNGWAPEAIRLLKRKFYNIDYDSFKNKQRTWLSIHCPNGVCAYDGPGPKLAGNTLVGYGWTENEDINTNAQVSSAVNAIQSWYLTDSNHWGLYYVYATTKGLRSFTPEITYLPNGTHWANEYIDFFLTGKNNTKNSNGASKQLNNGTWTWAGNWPWAGSFSTNERTAVTAQIIQSWLEVQPYAKASPQLISPNTPVVYDHSWSYSLDPQVSISSFRWNVIDYILPSLPYCSINITNNCNEDLNNNNIVDENEIIWDFTTTDINQTFSFTYTQDVAWGEIKKQKITLQTIDNLGRIVEDSDSVEIKISKFNHAPIAVPNTYTTYNKAPLTLDASNSYDSDISQSPFPGDDTRPQGIQDSITEISYDTDRDGVYETISNPITLTLNTTLDKITIPFKVCDDGQWTNLCKDDIENKDCSLCSYSSMTINVLPNTLPPIISTETNLVYTSDNVLIDLSGTTDPENLNISTSAEIVFGNGTLTKVNDLLYTYTPNGDGFRIDSIKIIATDEGGLSSEKTIYIEVPNIPPAISNPNIEHLNLPPVVLDVVNTEIGNGWYKVDIFATPNPIVKVKASVDIYDYDLFLSTDFIYQGNVYHFETSPYETDYLDSMGSGLFSVDSSDGVDISTLDIPFSNLPLSSYLSYTIDINTDGIIEVFNGSLNTYTYKTNTEFTNINIKVKDNLGLENIVNESFNTKNELPIIESVRIIKSDWQVLFIVNAIDKDNLTYTLYTGDGVTLNNSDGIFIYNYSNFGNYNPIVKVTDSRGGEVSLSLEEISYRENLAPVINNITTLVGYGGLVSFIVEATDEEQWSYSVYKDGNELIGDIIKLNYSPNPQNLVVRVEDVLGKYSEMPISVVIADTPTEVTLNHFKGQDVYIFLCNATDRDTDLLTYIWEVDGQIVNETTNNLIQPLDILTNHIVSVKVIDTWSNIEVIESVEILGENNPTITSVNEIVESGGIIELRIDSDATSYIVDWGDGVINNLTTHKYSHIGTYTLKVKGYKNNLESNEIVKDIIITDREPTLDNLYVNQIGNTSWIEVFVNEVDTEDLRYSFDLNNDGTWEYENRRSNRTTYLLNRSGVYTIGVKVLDTWSNIETTFIETFEIEEWENGVDNIQVSEGDCVWFKAEGLSAIKVDYARCSNNENNGDIAYTWRVNGEDLYGNEIGYVFEDDGIYDVSLNHNGVISRIRVHVENVAPEFISVPDSVVVAGNKYKYDIRVKDKGATDIIEVLLGQGAPTTMELKTGVEEGAWSLEWNVADNLGGGEASIVLIAEDTHRTEGYVTRDGGRTEQRFRIRILNNSIVQDKGVEEDKSIRDKEVEDMSIRDKDIEDMGAYSDIRLQDYVITEDFNLSRFRGNPSGCNSKNKTIGLELVLLLMFLISLKVRNKKC
jgi:hypothetical protein